MNDRKGWALLTGLGLGLGAGLLYLFDRGARRYEPPGDDDRLATRIRSRLRRLVSHADRIHIQVDRGQVTLSGPVSPREGDHAVRTISRLPGVDVVVNDLEPHEDALGIDRHGTRGTPWWPAAGVAAAVTGGAFAVHRLRRRARRDAAPHAGGHVVTVHKTLAVQAPIERVFESWSRYENFPIFMSTLREVRALGDGRSHWIVDGPAGRPASWEAELTAFVPNERISWRSVPGSIVDNGGGVRFRPNAGGGTQVEIQLSYDPPGGVLGHRIARLFGADPKSPMDADLVQMKAFIETGRRPEDRAAEPSHPL